MFRCPGQDRRFWKPEDVFEVRCGQCGTFVEFFKDEPKLKCRNCGSIVVNPKIDRGCAHWCQYADRCLKVSPATNRREQPTDRSEKSGIPTIGGRTLRVDMTNKSEGDQER
jgi:DNA-directed RNA polymerase subunit RPC12/RpoP